MLEIIFLIFFFEYMSQSYSHSHVTYIRYSLYWKVKVCRVGLEIYRVWKPYIKSLIIQTFQNDLGFSLYATLSVCYMITTLGDGLKSKEDEY